MACRWLRALILTELGGIRLAFRFYLPIDFNLLLLGFGHRLSG